MVSTWRLPRRRVTLIRFDEEVKRLIHVVGEGDGDFKVSCNRGEVRDVKIVFGAGYILSNVWSPQSRCRGCSSRGPLLRCLHRRSGNRGVKYGIAAFSDGTANPDVPSLLGGAGTGWR